MPSEPRIAPSGTRRRPARAIRPRPCVRYERVFAYRDRTSIPRPPPDEPPIEQLESEICELAAHIDSATCRWLLLVAEFDERRGWAEWGVHSCAHWLSWRCSIAPRSARERIRVARRLRELPHVRAAFSVGELSYSKVRALTRVAEPDTEQDLVQIARHATGAQLDKLVRGYGKGSDRQPHVHAAVGGRLARLRTRGRRAALLPAQAA